MAHRPFFTHIASAALALVALVALAGCGGSSSSVLPEGEFQGFVKDRFAETSDATDPTPINGRAFDDRTTLDEQAFSDLLPN